MVKIKINNKKSPGVHVITTRSCAYKKKKKRVFLLTLQFDWLPQKDDAYPRKILINGEKVVAFFKLRCFALKDIIA